GGRNSRNIFSCRHELQQRHLCGCILHCNSVGGKFNVSFSAVERGSRNFIEEVSVKNFLSESERTVEELSCLFYFVRKCFIHSANHVEIKNHCKENFCAKLRKKGVMEMKRYIENTRAQCVTSTIAE